MMKLLKDLYSYHDRATRRLWGCVAALSNAQFVQPTGYSKDSVRGHMVHLGWAEQFWLAHLKQQPRPQFQAEGNFPTAADAQNYWEQVTRETQVFLRSLKTEDLHQKPGGAGETVGQILLHLANHATDHRAQVLMMLHGFGAPTFEQDMMFFLGESLE